MFYRLITIVLISNWFFIKPADCADNSSGETRLFINGRLRYEYADQDGREDSNAFTLRNRAGFETNFLKEISFLAEVENTWAILGEDEYNPFPGPGKTIIADPENIELNRLQLSFNSEEFQSKATVGRQSIILDDWRFIGDVGWRQNNQTYDAVRFETKSFENVTFTYAYLAQVNRIFGKQAPLKVLSRLESDSHLFNLQFKEFERGTLTLFAYLLDFEEAPAISSKTYGARYNGATSQGEKLSYFYDFQWAIQQDYESNRSDYSANYFKLEGGIKCDNGITGGLGIEVLGEDNGSSFQTPLGTNHKFNGFADAFLTTPASGLNDFYT